MAELARINLYDYVRTVPDWPKEGVMFRDITPLLSNSVAFAQAIKELAEPFGEAGVAKVAGIDARGFILGGAIARNLNTGFVPIRKAGKLPYNTYGESYDLEYGSAVLEIHTDAVEPGENVLLVDDLIATGGTAEAAIKLLQKAGANVVAFCAIIDLPDLGGAQKLRETTHVSVHSLMTFSGE